jgi:hypothetical protein
MLATMTKAHLILLLFAGSAYPGSPKADWLVTPVQTPVTVEKSEDGREIVMDNGLIRRTFRLAPNAATVGLDNLMTGESVLRGVKPEARLTIEGLAFDIGGLKGQPNYAYLLDEWLDELRSDPRAFQFVDYQVGRTRPRFEWKRVRHSAEMPWPPPGASLTMDYRLGTEALQQLAESKPRVDVADRQVLIRDSMLTRSDAWRLHEADHDRSSFVNEGKFGEIYTPANTCVFAERTLPAEVKVVECRIDPGTDRSASWGPGIALVWPGRTVKFYLRPGAGQFGIFDGRGERLVGKLEDGHAYTLRIETTGSALFCDASLDGREWLQVAKIECDTPLTGPVTVRLGKTDRSGGTRDFSPIGDYARCRISNFRAYGALDTDALAQWQRVVSRLKDLTVSVHYEMYRGIPLLCKWLTVHNGADQPVRLNRFTSEILALVEYESHVENYQRWNVPNIHVESDYAFGGMNGLVANHTTYWQRDPEYMTQVSYPRENPCLLESRPPVGPDVDIAPGETFESFRTFELIFDSTERERKGLTMRRMYRTIAPWSTENPLMMHVRRADPKSVRLGIDQCAAVGFEMIIMTFGSGFNIENEDPAYLAQLKELADYAHSKGIEIGGYSLLSSRRISDEHDVIDIATGQPGGAKFGNAPCIGSEWGRDYFRKLYAFYEKTGFDLLEHDGSYPGDTCASQSHPGHRGYDDSQWTQWRTISDFYKWCRGRGVYLNVPDFYYLTGSTKCGMGYRETNWSLPRAQQIIHGRQNIYDATWSKTPSMGWMFVPLTQYHGGGAAATIEPLAEHLDAYAAHLANNLGAGVQACYRGPRLYDTEETKAVVKQWVNFFKRYRDILESDVIHVRRADGRDIDCLLHVNPQLDIKGLAMVYNPLDHSVERKLTLPLYYTGLTDTARIHKKDGASETYRLDRDYHVTVPVTIGARSNTWLIIR